ncbi:hypothetical protein VTJ83DRAFT_4671 [Remersonia thermophila]|uniref:Uncharacterized protein n=1 Tax=Remersonia thermophila TaxID=72144 RepID=A0ABR4DBI9_9PEZI
MLDLTIGQVSGLIATGVFLGASPTTSVFLSPPSLDQPLQTLLSIAFPAALVSVITSNQSAATWSVLGRALHASPWPTLLQTDSAARRGVRGLVSNVLLLQTATVFLVSIASIVTPLGLYEAVEPAPRADPVAFAYVRDATPFGLASSARLGGAAPFTRACGDEACPGSWANRTCVTQGSLEKCTAVVYGRRIPRVWYQEFAAGARTVGETVASIFDVQWRAQSNASDALGEDGWYVRSECRQTGVLVLERGLQLVDGLVVDAGEGGGGIGFRNHTAPAQPGLQYGATWDEDTLFVEPEVRCANLNVTLDFVLWQNSTSRLAPRDLVLTDRGGFSRLARDKPDLSFDAAQGNGQGPIDLRARAWRAAWEANYLTLAYFNATDLNDDEAVVKRLDVTPGMHFKSSSSAARVENFGRTDSAAFSVEYQAIRTALDFGEYLDLPSQPAPDASSSGNPFGITKAHFHRISERCGGADLSTRANLNATLIGCGIIYGIARRIDTDAPEAELSLEPGSRWSIPMYSCAASFRAGIRTVTLRQNITAAESGARDLSSLRIVSSRPKSYPSVPDGHPLWAVEDMGSIKLASAQPLWGIVAPSSPLLSRPPGASLSVATHRGPSLRLPGMLTSSYAPILQGTGYVPSRPGQNLPAVDFCAKALQAVFTIRRPGSPGYEGMVWTDVAANSVVGTKGWGLGGGGEDVVMVPVTVYRRRIRYRMLCIIPAVVVLALVVAVVSTWLVQMVRGQQPVASMRVMLEATSAGRLMGAILWRQKEAQEVGLKRARTDEWVDDIGKKTVIVAHETGTMIITTNNGSESDSKKDMVNL